MGKLQLFHFELGNFNAFHLVYLGRMRRSHEFKSFCPVINLHNFRYCFSQASIIPLLQFYYRIHSIFPSRRSDFLHHSDVSNSVLFDEDNQRGIDLVVLQVCILAVR